MERVSENVNLTPDELIELLWIVLQDIAKTSITKSPRVAELIEKGNQPCQESSCSESESQSSSSQPLTDKQSETSSDLSDNPDNGPDAAISETKVEEPPRQLSQAEQAQAEEVQRAEHPTAG